MGLAKRELLLQRGPRRRHHGDRLHRRRQPDDHRVAGLDDQGLERAPTGRVLRALSYHLVGVTGLDLSPDGRWLASGDGAGWLRVWDLVQRLRGPHRAPRTSAASTAWRSCPTASTSPRSTSTARLALEHRRPRRPRSRRSRSSGNGPGLRPSAAAGFALALAETDGKLRLLDADGTAVATLDGPGRRRDQPPARHRRPPPRRRRRRAAGSSSGTRGPTGVVFRRHDGRRRSTPLGLAPADWLAVAAGREVASVCDRPEGAGRSAPGSRSRAGEPASAFSNDGRWLAACTATGDLACWRSSDAGPRRAGPARSGRDDGPDDHAGLRARRPAARLGRPGRRPPDLGPARRPPAPAVPAATGPGRRP